THSPVSIPHATPPPGSPSSTLPSQSSSARLHVSTELSAGMHEYSQPSSTRPLMSWKPGSHAPRVHTPPLHAPVACGTPQTRPQRPQLSGSPMKSTSSSTMPSQSPSLRSQMESSAIGVAEQRYSQPFSAMPSRS